MCPDCYRKHIASLNTAPVPDEVPEDGQSKAAERWRARIDEARAAPAIPVGVSFCKSRRRWVGQVERAGVRHRRRFDRFEDACAFVAGLRAGLGAAVPAGVADGKRPPDAAERAAMVKARVPLKRAKGTGAVHLLKGKGLYQGAYTRNGEYCYLGLYPDRESAEAAVAEACGKFATTPPSA
jgi:hypothetical protein